MTAVLSDSVGQEALFDQLADAIASATAAAFTLTLSGEDSQFTRFNRGRVRQTGQVSDGQLILTLMQEGRTATAAVPFVGELATDRPRLLAALDQLLQLVPKLPVDPYIVVPEGGAHSRTVHRGELLAPAAVADTLLPGVAGLDFTGIYAGGLSYRGYADSAGQRHWFETTSYSLDFSIFDGCDRAIKGTVADSQWQPQAYLDKIEQARQQLPILALSPKQVGRGQYRTYLAPAAVAELLDMFSWGGVSETALQNGNSPFCHLRQGSRRLSPRFTLRENFDQVSVPRFNLYGEVAPSQLPVIDQGQLVNSLVSARSARKYQRPSNCANPQESLRAPEILPGQLERGQILPQLDRGLYVSNLHYLNWSDQPQGRVTGMTRYACFWVENGEIVAPISNLRFDESLYRCFGDALVDLTRFQETIPNVGTYGQRSLGGSRVPGLLTESFTYTL